MGTDGGADAAALAEPLAVSLLVAGYLDALGVRYLVGGSVASSLLGLPRATLDADLVADLDASHVGPLVAALGDATAEDMVLQKLDWFRRGDGVSDRQWNDVLGLLKTRGASLDRAYLDRWAPALDLDDLLAAALAGGRPPRLT